jgi:hypothetical protein
MAKPPRNETQIDRRGDERGPLAGRVTVRFPAATFEAHGQNVSADGALFVLEDEVAVTVQIEGERAPRSGVLVRANALGPGKLGMAVRFVATK